MKLIFAILSLLITVGCATDPYKVCYDDKDISASESSQNYCIEQVRQNQMKAASIWASMHQQQYVQPQQVQTYQMPVRQSTQTNCNPNLNGGFNCTSY